MSNDAMKPTQSLAEKNNLSESNHILDQLNKNQANRIKDLEYQLAKLKGLNRKCSVCERVLKDENDTCTHVIWGS